jgi:hypothetical protein
VVEVSDSARTASLRIVCDLLKLATSLILRIVVQNRLSSDSPARFDARLEVTVSGTGGDDDVADEFCKSMIFFIVLRDGRLRDIIVGLIIAVVAGA